METEATSELQPSDIINIFCALRSCGGERLAPVVPSSSSSPSPAGAAPGKGQELPPCTAAPLGLLMGAADLKLARPAPTHGAEHMRADHDPLHCPLLPPSTSTDVPLVAAGPQAVGATVGKILVQQEWCRVAGMAYAATGQRLRLTPAEVEGAVQETLQERFQGRVEEYRAHFLHMTSHRLPHEARRRLRRRPREAVTAAAIANEDDRVPGSVEAFASNASDQTRRMRSGGTAHPPLTAAVNPPPFSTRFLEQILLDTSDNSPWAPVPSLPPSPPVPGPLVGGRQTSSRWLNNDGRGAHTEADRSENVLAWKMEAGRCTGVKQLPEDWAAAVALGGDPSSSAAARPSQAQIEAMERALDAAPLHREAAEEALQLCEELNWSLAMTPHQQRVLYRLRHETVLPLETLQDLLAQFALVEGGNVFFNDVAPAAMVDYNGVQAGPYGSVIYVPLSLMTMKRCVTEVYYHRFEEPPRGTGETATETTSAREPLTAGRRPSCAAPTSDAKTARADHRPSATQMDPLDEDGGPAGRSFPPLPCRSATSGGGPGALPLSPPSPSSNDAAAGQHSKWVGAPTLQGVTPSIGLQPPLPEAVAGQQPPSALPCDAAPARPCTSTAPPPSHGSSTAPANPFAYPDFQLRTVADLERMLWHIAANCVLFNAPETGFRLTATKFATACSRIIQRYCREQLLPIALETAPVPHAANDPLSHHAAGLCLPEIR
eukprot:gene12174-8375_t